MNIFEFTDQIRDKDRAIEFLRQRDILRSDPPECPNYQCNRQMTLVKRRDKKDGMEALCGLSNRTVIDWNNFLREICSQQLLNNPIRLGGVGRVVQIDESLMARRKYHRGHEVPERWVFGMYDVHQQIGDISFYV
uniref:Transposase n=1 Tax=Globodera rostochiensis TaxID=31243 RepID=A0A914HGG1_GLORO